MQITKELSAYLSRAAQGDESECPPDVDAVWHACLAYPQAYEEYCLKTFGVIIDHVTDRPAPCRGRIHQSALGVEEVQDA
jgi:hypothetical protein